MGDIEIKMGLPIRTISTVTKAGGDKIQFSVSTESVQELITAYLDNGGEQEEAFESFDDDVMYYVPDSVFLGSVKDLVEFINSFDNIHKLK